MPLDGPLHKAAYKGDYGVIDDHLSLYPDDVNVAGAQNRTPLHRAIGGGIDKKAVVELLLSKKANPNIPDVGGLTPLHWAASFGIVAFGKMLIDHAADVNAVTNSGETPLHFCAEKGHIDFVRLLLEHNADINIRDRGPNGGSTPYDAAKRSRQTECMQLLRPQSSGGCCTIM